MPYDIFSDDDAVMVQPETSRVAGYCDDHLRRLEKAGGFPARFKLNPSAGWKSKNGWSRRAVMAWRRVALPSRPRNRDMRQIYRDPPLGGDGSGANDLCLAAGSAPHVPQIPPIHKHDDIAISLAARFVARKYRLSPAFAAIVVEQLGFNLGAAP